MIPVYNFRFEDMLIVFTFQVQSSCSTAETLLLELVAQGQVKYFFSFVVEHVFVLTLPQGECLKRTEMFLHPHRLRL